MTRLTKGHHTRRATRAGLRVRGHRGHPVARQAIIRFCIWVREHHEFPIRVPVYLYGRAYVRTRNGERVSATFFAPFDRNVEPYIRISTGDYPALRSELGRNNALASILCSVAHELVHYWQWVETGKIWERGVRKKARSIVDGYAETTDRP